MKKKLLTGIAIFAVIAIGWHVFEAIWDQSLFPKEEGGVTSRNIGVKELRELMENSPDLQLVDVRPQGSYESARLDGAVNAPFKKTAKKFESGENLDPSKPVLVYCDGGFRSRLAIPALKEAGFTEIYHLHRGMIAWRLQGGECASGALKP
ncbi:MAG: rhodanese-like domain-containing protein [Verrucomicrobiota bacterium]